jgi:N-acetylmuramoyl-L-alanine amidase
MKKTALLLIILIFLPLISHADISMLKLRASRHPGFLRIVLEGYGPVIQKGLVYQRGRDILVSFPDTNFSIQSESSVIAYSRVNKDTVIISTGGFRGLKVFTLKHPARLVIDVHMKEDIKAPLPVPSAKKGRKIDLSRIESVVIDPGHGGYENGMVLDNNKEKNTVLDISKKLASLVDRGSSQGFMTRGSDRFMSLSERVAYTNSKDPDVFVSLHIGNHSDVVIYVPDMTDKMQGITFQYLDNKGQAEYREETMTLLKAMREAVISNFGDDMVSVKTIPFSITSRIEAAALIIEFPSFEDAYYNEELNSELANTLFKGLYIYEEIKSK